MYYVIEVKDHDMWHYHTHFLTKAAAVKAARKITSLGYRARVLRKDDK